jgi:hypothetical protein
MSVSASRDLKSDGRLVLLVTLHSPADEWVSAHESERVIVCSGDVREAGPASDHSLLTRRNSMVPALTRATMSPRSSGPYPLRFGTTTWWNSTTQVGDGMAVGRPRLACAVSAAIVSVTVWTLLGSRNPPCAEAASTAAPSSPLPAGLVTGVRCQWMRLRLFVAFALTPDDQLRVPGSAAVLADLAWSRPPRPREVPPPLAPRGRALSNDSLPRARSTPCAQCCGTCPSRRPA